MRFAAFIALLTAALLLGSCEAVSKVMAQTFSISGRVFDSASGFGVENAKVMLNPGEVSVQTGADGSYSFDELDAGSYVVSVTSAAGYAAFAPTSREVTVGPADSVGNDFSAANEEPPVIWPPDDHPIQPGAWDFGSQIYRLPVDSEGHAHVTVENFAPGQQAAVVAINMDPLYLDAHSNSSGSFPSLSDSGYSFEAEQVKASAASASRGAAACYEQLTPQSDYALKAERNETLSPLTLYEREARAAGSVPFAVEPARAASLLQKGEVRTFIDVPQRTSPNPPIQPGAQEPSRDLSKLRWPQLYNSQDGRLVAVGQHCLVFLSTEINSGHPETLRFTQRRLNRMANEFDNNIFPVASATFGPVKNYEELAVYREVDRSIVLTGDDFDADGKLTRTLPGSVDTSIANEGKILIFIENAPQGEFFTYGSTLDEKTGLKTEVGSTLYVAGDNFPADEANFNAAFSLLAHEFQHKLYHDNGLPERATEYDWLNEGLSQLSMYVCGYTPNSGKLIHWAVDQQLVDYLQHTSSTAVPMDANPHFGKDEQYGSGLLFFLYMFEHYDPGVGRRIYDAATKEGVSDRVKLVERCAQYTLDGVTHQDTFEQLYSKFAIANFVDGIDADYPTDFDDRFHYATIDLRGTVNLSTGAIQVPGVRVGVFPENSAYSAIDNDRLVIPWGIDYLVFGSGDGRDLDVQFSADPNYKFFMLPVNVATDSTTGDPATNRVRIDVAAMMLAP